MVLGDSHGLRIFCREDRHFAVASSTCDLDKPAWRWYGTFSSSSMFQFQIMIVDTGMDMSRRFVPSVFYVLTLSNHAEQFHDFDNLLKNHTSSQD
jgi:hypothetical protein